MSPLRFDDFVSQQRGLVKKVPGGIADRWIKRVVPRGLHTQGEAGARVYLADYGRGIGVDKLVHLALYAETQNSDDMALGFWKRAYQMETDQAAPSSATLSGSGFASPSSPRPASQNPLPVIDQVVTAAMAPTVPELPDRLQPGNHVSMKPVDAAWPRDYYINSPDYFGQPKRDGHYLVVFVTALGEVYYRKKSVTSFIEAPSAEIDTALRAAGSHFGAFVFEGELYYEDALGGEHRTAAQAAEANIQLERGHVQPLLKLAIFKCLYAVGVDLCGEPERERIAQAEVIGGWLTAHCPESIEVLPTARTVAEKQALAARQFAEGREGEVWVRADCLYLGGDDGKLQTCVRTKYIDELDVVVMGFTKSTVPDRPFGAIKVGLMRDGQLVSVGSVGTGYTHQQMHDLLSQHRGAPGEVVIKIGTQGFTEGGKLWQARYIGLHPDKQPVDCVFPARRVPVAQTTNETGAPAAASDLPPALVGEAFAGSEPISLFD